jgi:hypothetical protein
MFRPITLAALTLMVASPTLSQTTTPAPHAASARAYPALDDIHWTYGAEGAVGQLTDQLRFTRDGMNTSFGSDKAPLVMGERATASLNSPGEAVSFVATREAGALVCTGRVESAGRASGTCRFDPDARFAADLARRGLPPEDSDQLLTLTLVDAHLASVDDLTTQGFRFDDAGDLVAVAALAVTPAYAGELRDAGLKIDDLGDLVAAKALKIDGEWLHQMAQAGYPALDVDRAIQMRALGVTPEYARKMARVLRAVGEIE